MVVRPVLEAVQVAEWSEGRGITEVAETGIDLIALNPVYDMERQARRLAAEVLPLMGFRL